MILFGLVMALKGPSYRLGTLMHMGPGFLPTVLGVILIGLGIAIAAASLAPSEGGGEEEEESILPANPEWWAWGCILASPVAFMVAGAYGGLAPATFACVFVAAMGDRGMTYKQAVVLSCIITFFGVGLFHYVLQIPMPVLAWRG